MAEATENTGFSSPFDRGWPLRYGVAPSTVALALAARALLTPVLHDDTIFFYFIPPVLISAGIGGLGPGLLATALSLAAAFFLMANAASFSSLDFSQWHRIHDHSASAYHGAANRCTAAACARRS